MHNMYMLRRYIHTSGVTYVIYSLIHFTKHFLGRKVLSSCILLCIYIKKHVYPFSHQAHRQLL